MSTLTQRFLSELDIEWSHLSPAERETEKQRVAARLESLVQAEQELGADVLEAQRRAVRSVGQECTLQPKTAVRLSPVWQVALIWLAVKVIVEELLRAVTILVLLESSDGQVIVSTGFVAMGLIGALIATLVARLWHPRAALRGILCGLGIPVLFGTVWFFLFYLSNLPPHYSRDAILRSNLIAILGMVLTTLGTLLFVPKLTRKFRRHSL